MRTYPTNLLLPLLVSSLLSSCSLEQDDDAPFTGQTEIFGSKHEDVYAALALSISRPGSDGPVNCSGVMLNNHIILTAAHCLHAVGAPAGDYSRDVRIRYTAPDGQSIDIQKEMFFYTHRDYHKRGDRSDWAIGASDESFGLSNTHFATLFRGSLQDGDFLNFASNGAPTIAETWTLETTMNHIDEVSAWWTSDDTLQGFCGGDSGAPGFRASGHFHDDEPMWRSVAVLERSISTKNALPSKCNNNGGASVIGDHEWIQSIVELWPRDAPGSRTCHDFTNNAGDPVSWCWQATDE